jgi:hypothetical protein
MPAIPVDGSDKRIIRKSEKAFDFTTVYIARGEGERGNGDPENGREERIRRLTLPGCFHSQTGFR